MRNPLQIIDDLVMSGVNSGVSAWNYTTGRTKADLAQILMYSGPVGFFSATYFNPIYMITGVISIHVAAKFSKLSKLTQKLEESASNKDMKNRLVEGTKPLYQIGGYGMQVMAPVHLSLINDETNLVENQLAALSFFSMGVASHVMRAEYMPPRKDCIRRGIDKLAEMFKRDSQEPAIGIN